MASPAHAVPPIDLDPDTHQRITLIAQALGATPGDIIRQLLAPFSHQNMSSQRVARATLHAAPAPIALYAIYARTRIDALYDPATAAVTIPYGPCRGIYKSPSGASAAVLRSLRPNVSPIRSGWSFWRIASSGQPLSTLRTTPPTAVPGGPATPPTRHRTH